MKNGCCLPCQGANMPSTPRCGSSSATAFSSALPRLPTPARGHLAWRCVRTHAPVWTFEEVDERLRTIMKNIYASAAKAASDYGMPGNLLAGANIAGF